ncbi:Alpha-D-ribose 1-methylphosphonate 5-triphosphate synthase subunit PhnH [Pelagimonas phthalicica]|uniref:Alpha-D-ribose 1-methylphosphonate 5-triphosphate synthase subunit PhnH n=1 Tax=Pelagimonas phthalicica TaxID=1037362 RepID=A0A238J9Y1_9RHOB|nr:phosphonate C-P lyase system protein PhnH [Pelagimonas phthalicica]TDS93956.1 alpha-D-ribose 1-methylphosphonate 5-triphosphate synthase subunit PhnH [Pelagimonas phthalicica]SMX27520.1 Alpha-D-ribose 1-methylphosphonate 5-triphosphate synthase subunit PhnH [Pelagimonas phthalicica]
MNSAALSGGFANPAQEAAHGFRALMNAMARPGEIFEVSGGQGPAPLSIGAAVTLLTLCDADTGLYLAPSFDSAEMRGWVAFHFGAPLVPAERADFALGRWEELLPLEQYRIGTAEYPDRSATLIVESDSLTQNGATLRGPGIKDSAALSLPETTAFQANHTLFPLGLDFVFTAGAQLAALPRSTEVN